MFIRFELNSTGTAAAREVQSQENDEVEMPLFDFTEIEVATNNFSFHNKIGEGGFGPVYKVFFPYHIFALIIPFVFSVFHSLYMLCLLIM